MVYVNDILVKGKKEDRHLDDLYLYDMKLNPSKYVFGVWSRKFLGFMVS